MLTRTVGILVWWLRNLAAGYYRISANFSLATPLKCLLETEGLCSMAMTPCSPSCSALSVLLSPGHLWLQATQALQEVVALLTHFVFRLLLKQLTRHPAGIASLLAAVWRPLAQSTKTVPEDHSDTSLFKWLLGIMTWAKGYPWLVTVPRIDTRKKYSRYQIYGSKFFLFFLNCYFHFVF